MAALCPPVNPLIPSGSLQPYGLACYSPVSCPPQIVPSNQTGGGGSNPPVWCLSGGSTEPPPQPPPAGALPSTSLPPSTQIQAISPGGTLINPNPFTDIYYFGLTNLIAPGNNTQASQQQYLPAPTNPCDDDPYCVINGMAQANTCCNAPVGVVVQQGIASAAQIDAFCVPGEQTTTGCLPCNKATGYYPRPQAISTHLSGTTDTATYYTCLPLLINIQFTNGAQTNYNVNYNNTQLDYSVYLSVNGAYDESNPVAVGFISPGVAMVRLAPDEVVVFRGWAVCRCQGEAHCQTEGPFYIEYATAQAVLPPPQSSNTTSAPIIPSMNVDFTGNTGCRGVLSTICDNGSIIINVTPSGIAQAWTAASGVPLPMRGGNNGDGCENP